MKHLISEIKSNLESGNYLSALALTLTLPDICGKIKFPNEKEVGVRYSKWYDEYIYEYEKSPIDIGKMNTLVPDGKIIYKLRCCLFHDGSLDIENIARRKNKIDDSTKFKFILTNNQTSISKLSEGSDESKVFEILIRIGVEDLCFKICAVAENFYNDHYPNKDIFNNVIICDFN